MTRQAASRSATERDVLTTTPAAARARRVRRRAISRSRLRRGFSGRMELDPARCYEAARSRDPRFDGRIFAGVVTTGVYCRPICRVAPAKPENVRWFPCAAAAEAAGFRPCLRCRPEAAPGTPAWMGTSAVVSRALRLIAEDALDDGGMDALAARVGLGARQLRRLFREHLGTSPAAVARARRAHLARRLLDETTLSIADLAFAAGFKSIRQFNHAMRATFRRAPRELRARRTARAARSTATAAGLVLRLAYRPPFDWVAIARFLAARAIPGVEAVDLACYRRTIEVEGVPGALEVRPDAPASRLVLRVRLADYRGLALVVERVRRVFDLGADPLTIAGHLGASAALERLVAARPGLRVPGAWDAFELGVRAILGQQVTVRGATTLAGRLVRAFGRPLEDAEPGLSHLFPTAAILAGADLTPIGLPRARAETMRAFAAAIAGGELVLDAAKGLEDAVARLTAIPGIGSWTAHYIAMRALGEPDAFPAGDLGLRRALGNGGGPVSAAELARAADTWRPWRSYAALHLWTTDGEKGEQP